MAKRKPLYTPPTDDQEDTMTDQAQTNAVDEYEEVRPGENALLFAERVGVHPDRIHELNHEDLEAHARTLGFDSHRFIRRVPNDDGTHSERPDYHVFAGQRLKVRRAGG